MKVNKIGPAFNNVFFRMCYSCQDKLVDRRIELEDTKRDRDVEWDDMKSVLCQKCHIEALQILESLGFIGSGRFTIPTGKGVFELKIYMDNLLAAAQRKCGISREEVTMALRRKYLSPSDEGDDIDQKWKKLVRKLEIKESVVVRQDSWYKAIASPSQSCNFIPNKEVKRIQKAKVKTRIKMISKYLKPYTHQLADLIFKSK